MCVTKSQQAALLSQSDAAGTPISVSSSASTSRDASPQNPCADCSISVRSTTPVGTPPIIVSSGFFSACSPASERALAGGLRLRGRSEEIERRGHRLLPGTEVDLPPKGKRSGGTLSHLDPVIDGDDAGGAVAAEGGWREGLSFTVWAIFNILLLEAKTIIALRARSATDVRPLCAPDSPRRRGCNAQFL